MSLGLVTRGLLNTPGDSATPPAFSGVSPTDGSELADSETPITFTVDNPSNVPFAICIKFAGESRPFVVYDSTRGFYHPFTNSTTDGSGGFVIRQDPYWQDDIADLFLSGVA